MTAMMRSRSSTEANSTVIFPLRRPRSTRTRVSKVSERRSASSAMAGAVIRGVALRRPGLGLAVAVLMQGDELLGGTHRQALGDHPRGQVLLGAGVVETEQRPGMTGGQHTGRDPPLHGDGQVQQPDGVADDRATAADALRELVVGDAEFLEQLLVGSSLLQRIELGAVDVLQQRVAQHGVVGCAAHYGRDGLEAGGGRRAQAALAHHQLVAVGDAPHHHRLQHPELAHRVGQFGERVLVEDLARLLGVGLDLVQAQFGELRAGDREQVFSGIAHRAVRCVGGGRFAGRLGTGLFRGLRGRFGVRPAVRGGLHSRLRHRCGGGDQGTEAAAEAADARLAGHGPSLPSVVVCAPPRRAISCAASR